MFGTKKDKTSAVPAVRPLSANPEYVAATADLAGWEREADELRGRLDSLKDFTDVERQAEALLQGKAVETPLNAGENVESMRHRLAVLHRAITLGREKVQQLTREHARKECAAVAPVHKAAVVRMARALVEAGKAGAEEAGVRDAIEADGLRVCHPLLNCGFAELGDVRDLNSPACQWLRDQIEAGFFTRDEPWLAGTALAER